MPSSSWAPRRAVLLLPLAALLALPAAAQEVTLRMKGGTFQITGNLKSFDGRKYALETPQLGMISLDAARFDCLGAGCGGQARDAAPRPAPPQPTAALVAPPGARASIAIEGAGNLAATLLPGLVKAWAGSTGGSTVRMIGTDTAETRLRVLDKAGNEIAGVEIRKRPVEAALAALRSGSAQLAISERAVTDPEAAALAPVAGDIRSAGRETVVALDAMTVIVAPESPVASLSMDQLARIFGGQLTNWSQVGLPAAPIAVHGVEPAASFAVFNDRILRPGGRPVAAAVRQHPSFEAVADAVVQDRNSIGFAPLALIAGAKPLNIQQSCGLIAQPSHFAARAEEYPFTRRLYLYAARPTASPQLKSFLDFVVSESAQDIVADSHVISQAVGEQPFGEQTARFAYAASLPGARFDAARLSRLVADVGKASRLSATIRFRSGTSGLDIKSQQDLRLLAAAMQRPHMRARSLLLVGYSDGSGTEPKNVALSLRRAQEVRAALLAAAGGAIAPARVVVRGLGSLAPVACEETPQGKQLNRRVEAWITDEAPAAGPAPAPGPRAAAVPPGKRKR